MNYLTQEKGAAISDSANRASSPFKSRIRIVSGLALLASGLICAIPGVPGPGGAMIIVALLILSDHFVWAKKSLNWMRSKARQAGLPNWKWLHGQTDPAMHSHSHGNGRARENSERC